MPTMKIARFTLIYIFIMLAASEIMAKDIPVKNGDIPVWDGSIYTNYLFKMSDKVTANVGFCDGGRRDNGKTYPFNAGCIGFSFINKQERIKRRGKRHLVKPAFYPVHTKIWLGDQLFLDEIKPDRDTGEFLIHFPYAMKKISVSSLYSDGKQYSFTVRTPKIPYSDIHYDNRKRVPKPHKGYKFNKPDSLFLGKGGGYLGFSCTSSKKGGYIKSMSAYLHRHPIFAPDGDRPLGKYIIHMPVYQVQLSRFWFLPMEIPPKLRVQDHTFTITGTCTMRSGKKITLTKKTTIRRESLPSGGGASLRTYIP